MTRGSSPIEKTEDSKNPFEGESLEDHFEEEFDSAENIDDCFESDDRLMFVVNETLEEYFFGPLTKVYCAEVSDGVRLALRNAFFNATVPVNFASSFI